MKLRANLMLLMTAFIWGFAFVAQRVGMDYVDPFTFNGMRFTVGAGSLLPLIWYFRRKYLNKTNASEEAAVNSWRIGLLAGTILFIAASLQQIGMMYTTAGKAAFITCLYIVLVPLGKAYGRRRRTRTFRGGLFLSP